MVIYAFSTVKKFVIKVLDQKKPSLHPRFRYIYVRTKRILLYLSDNYFQNLDNDQAFIKKKVNHITLCSKYMSSNLRGFKGRYSFLKLLTASSSLDGNTMHGHCFIQWFHIIIICDESTDVS